MRVFQCAVMGPGGVGKSAVTVRFINGSYLEWYDPTTDDELSMLCDTNAAVEDSYRKQFVVDDQPCLLEILDTAGIDQFLTLNDLFIRESEAFVLVFSLNQRDSLDEVVRIRETIMRIKSPNIPQAQAQTQAQASKQGQMQMGEKSEYGAQYFTPGTGAGAGIATIPIVIVGNKADLTDDREIDSDLPEKLARQWDCSYFETSARTDTNISQVFEDVVRQLRRYNSQFERRDRDTKRFRGSKGKKCII